ncbi:MAG: hypothetical protein ACXVB1_17145 [Pseudobdellovibrionaceae bacterium]
MKFLFLSLLFILSSVGHAQSEGSTSRSALYEDIPVSNSLEESQNFDTPSDDSGSNLEDRKLKFRQKIEEFATNEFRTPEGRTITQEEANLLVKYFVQLKLPPEVLTSMEYQANLKIPTTADKAQVIQTIINISKTRTDMAAYMEHPNVRCFYRNYRDTNAVEEVLANSKNPKLMAPLADIFKRSDDVVIVGKCQGCGLLALDEFAMSPEERAKYSACAGK